MGYDVGKIDGIIGADTRRAVQTEQQKHRACPPMAGRPQPCWMPCDHAGHPTMAELMAALPHIAGRAQDRRADPQPVPAPRLRRTRLSGQHHHDPRRRHPRRTLVDRALVETGRRQPRPAHSGLDPAAARDGPGLARPRGARRIPATRSWPIWTASLANLPTGTLIQAGTAVLRVSDDFNAGCAKWKVALRCRRPRLPRRAGPPRTAPARRAVSRSNRTARWP